MFGFEQCAVARAARSQNGNAKRDAAALRTPVALIFGALARMMANSRSQVNEIRPNYEKTMLPKPRVVGCFRQDLSEYFAFQDDTSSERRGKAFGRVSRTSSQIGSYQPLRSSERTSLRGKRLRGLVRVERAEADAHALFLRADTSRNRASFFVKGAYSTVAAQRQHLRRCSTKHPPMLNRLFCPVRWLGCFAASRLAASANQTVREAHGLSRFHRVSQYYSLYRHPDGDQNGTIISCERSFVVVQPTRFVP